MPLQVQIQRFGEHARATRAGACALKFLFSKNSNGPLYVLIFSCENWHAGSFYNYEQMQKNRNFSFKNSFFWPPKSAFLVFEEKKNQKIFSLCFCSDSALKTIDAPMFLIGILENALKNTEQNRIYALKKLKKWKKLKKIG